MIKTLLRVKYGVFFVAVYLLFIVVILLSGGGIEAFWLSLVASGGLTFKFASVEYSYPTKNKGDNLDGWLEISSAPKSGEVLVKNGDYVYISEYRPSEVDGSGFGVIHSCCGSYEDIKPTHWKRI